METLKGLHNKNTTQQPDVVLVKTYDHQMSLVEVGETPGSDVQRGTSGCHVQGVAPGRMLRLGVVPYHVTYSMMHVILPTLSLGTERHTPVKTLPSRNFLGGR